MVCVPRKTQAVVFGLRRVHDVVCGMRKIQVAAFVLFFVAAVFGQKKVLAHTFDPKRGRAVVLEYLISQDANCHQWRQQAVISVQLILKALDRRHLKVETHDLWKPVAVKHCQGKLSTSTLG